MIVHYDCVAAKRVLINFFAIAASVAERRTDLDMDEVKPGPCPDARNQVGAVASHHWQLGHVESAAKDRVCQRYQRAAAWPW